MNSIRDDLDSMGEKVEKLLQRNTESFFDMQGMAFELFNMKHRSHSLYLRLGGQAAVQNIADALYDRVLKDDRVSEAYEKQDVEKLRHQQMLFLCQAFGGATDEYDARSMRHAHQFADEYFTNLF